MKKYLITSPEFYSDLEKQIQKHDPEYILYRDKENPYYAQESEKFLNKCRDKSSAKLFLHQDIELANRLKAEGVHLTSLQFDEIKPAKKLGLEVIISTHSPQEVLKAEELGADAVTYSPIFATPNKGRPKGVKELEEVLNSCKVKVFALGGIVTQKEVDLVSNTKAYGFASIRYFV